jgi:D-alanine-D-alanine ligase
VTRVLVLYNDDTSLLERGEAQDRIAVEGAASAAAAIARALAGPDFEPELAPAGSDPGRLAALAASCADGVIFNVCEAFGGESRLEYAVAAALELARVAYTGNPPLALALAQDKHLAKAVLAAAGVPVARSTILAAPGDPLPEDLRPPLFVKTRFEDASHGISEESLCSSIEAVRRRADYLIRTYRQDAIVEEFLPGREFNVGVILDGEVLPLAEIDWQLPPGVPRIVTYEAKWVESSPSYGGTPVACPARDVPPALAARLAALARTAYRALGCRDYARVDVRLDGGGEPRVLEVNPNPDLSPDAGLARAAARAGIAYPDLVRRIAHAALARRATRPARASAAATGPEGLIRPAAARDRGAIARILLATGAFTPEEVKVALELVDIACARPDEDYIVRVLDLAGAGVVGYTCYGRAPFTEAAFDLYWIAVDPAHHGTGAARRLMAAAEDDVRARGGRLLLVETASKPSYARTRRFYESIGYREAARVRDFYRAGDDKVIYEKRW